MSPTSHRYRNSVLPYESSKWACDLVALGSNEKYKEQGSKIVSYSTAPGVVASTIGNLPSWIRSVRIWIHYIVSSSNKWRKRSYRAGGYWTIDHMDERFIMHKLVRSSGFAALHLKILLDTVEQLPLFLSHCSRNS